LASKTQDVLRYEGLLIFETGYCNPTGFVKTYLYGKASG
jgi:hypothetical protein